MANVRHYIIANALVAVLIYVLIANGTIPVPDAETIFVKKAGLKISGIKVIYQNETNFTSPELLINVKVLNKNYAKPSNSVAVYAEGYLAQEGGRIYINTTRGIFEGMFPVGERNITITLKIGDANPYYDSIALVIYLEVRTDAGERVVERKEVSVHGTGPWVFD